MPADVDIDGPGEGVPEPNGGACLGTEVSCFAPVDELGREAAERVVRDELIVEVYEERRGLRAEPLADSPPRPEIDIGAAFGVQIGVATVGRDRLAHAGRRVTEIEARESVP